MVIFFNSNETDKFGVGSSKGWLMICDSEGVLSAEVSIPEASAMTPANMLCLTVAGPIIGYPTTDLAEAMKRAQTEAAASGKRFGTPKFDSIVAAYDWELNARWNVDLPPSGKMFGPRLASTPVGETIATIAGLQDVAVLAFGNDGDVKWRIDEEQVPEFVTGLSVEDVAIFDETLYTFGHSSTMKAKSVFLNAYNISERKLKWRKAYKEKPE